MTIAEMPGGWFRHPAALVETSSIGRGTRVWAFAHVLPGARIGADCNLCDHVFVENDVVVGDRVTVKCGVQLWDGVTLEDDVFVGPNATFTNDPFPRSRRRPERFTPTLVRSGASIGAGATILCGRTIGANAMVGAGAVVTRDVPANAIVAGNPARIRGYVGTRIGAPARNGASAPPPAHRVASLVRLPHFVDLRGGLVAGETGRELPFVPKRFFVVHSVPSPFVRGEHAHRALHQLLVCLVGTCRVVVDDGRDREEVRLDEPTLGLHLPPMTWATQYQFSADAVLLVLASEAYDPDDYVRDYDEFVRLVRRKGSEAASTAEGRSGTE